MTRLLLRVAGLEVFWEFNLYLVETKLFFAKAETMFGTEAERGEEPLRWPFRVATIGARRNENNDSESGQSWERLIRLEPVSESRLSWDDPLGRLRRPGGCGTP